MVLIRSRTFLFCLPVRYGVLVLSVLSILGGGALAAFGFLIAITQSLRRGVPPDRSVEAAFYLQGLAYTALTLVAIVGFVVSILKRQRLIYLYGVTLLSLFFLALVSGVFSIVVLFYTDAHVECLAALPNPPATTCDNSALVSGLMVGLYVLVWVIVAYACVMIPNYAEEISVQAHLSSTTASSSSSSSKRPAMTISHPKLHFHTTYNSYTPTAAEYPFTDPRQAFGVSAIRASAVHPPSPLPRTSITHTPITNTPIVYTPSLAATFPAVPRTPRVVV
ncbi:hypothetical protein ONZ45_g10021 [Pleurotus djamor]|nr:hypothetical protein ONZ45_g10021 [Pleurotus djamor]